MKKLSYGKTILFFLFTSANLVIHAQGKVVQALIGYGLARCSDCGFRVLIEFDGEEDQTCHDAKISAKCKPTIHAIRVHSCLPKWPSTWIQSRRAAMTTFPESSHSNHRNYRILTGCKRPEAVSATTWLEATISKHEGVEHENSQERGGGDWKCGMQAFAWRPGKRECESRSQESNEILRM